MIPGLLTSGIFWSVTQLYVLICELILRLITHVIILYLRDVELPRGCRFPSAQELASRVELIRPRGQGEGAGQCFLCLPGHSPFDWSSDQPVVPEIESWARQVHERNGFE